MLVLWEITLIIVFMHMVPLLLFQAGCSEKLIQQRTGHRSFES